MINPLENDYLRTSRALSESTSLWMTENREISGNDKDYAPIAKSAKRWQRSLPAFNSNNENRNNNWRPIDKPLDTNSWSQYCPNGYNGPVPYTADCRRFINCWNGEGHLQSCGPETVFNPTTLTCDHSDKVYGCGNAVKSQHTKSFSSSNIDSNLGLGDFSGMVDRVDVVCKPEMDGMQPHPNDCTKFINCANGNVHVKECGPGTAFNSLMNVCDYKSKVDCDRQNQNNPITSNKPINTIHPIQPINPIGAFNPSNTNIKAINTNIGNSLSGKLI